jgi:hypothetical protein
MKELINPGSFRDPSGFVFERDGTLFRQVNSCYAEDFAVLENSGLLRELQENGDLVAHEDCSLDKRVSDNACRILKPALIPFISYPYEWSFSQLKDAALLTLDIQRRALAHAMSLKDASTYNIQFSGGRAVFIDTLSFERYQEGGPWVAYNQFCRHFLAPLALMSCTDVRMGQLLRTNLDGIPLDLASRLLPMSTYASLGLLLHIHLHARSQKKYSSFSTAAKTRQAVSAVNQGITRTRLLGIIDHLHSTVKHLRWNPAGTQWADYYTNNDYSGPSFASKTEIVESMLAPSGVRGAQTVWDIGANDGTFSRLSATHGALTVSIDGDPAAVEQNYLRCKSSGEKMILPLLIDLTNPSPGTGWNSGERAGLAERGPADTVVALALIHHLCIGNNLPFDLIAAFFARIGRRCILEFVPSGDPQAQKLLKTRKDIYSWYNENEFVAQFGKYFLIESRVPITGSGRILFLMKRNS